MALDGPTREAYVRFNTGHYLVRCLDLPDITFHTYDLVSVPETKDIKLRECYLMYPDSESPERYNVIVDASGTLWYGSTYDSLRRHDNADDFENRLEVTELDLINRVRAAMGRKPKMPAWASEAIAHGFTPPSTFKVEDYE